MASTVEGRIWNALMARLQVLHADIDLPIAWDNRSFTPPADGKYLRIAFIPNTAERRFIGSNDPHRFIGLLQISVCWPKNTFLDPPLEMAGQVAGYFPCDLRLSSDGVTVRVTKHPDVAGLIVEDAGVMVPVSVEWESWS